MSSAKIIKVGTDCSGIEAPIQALNKLGIKYEHLFSSEIDKHARKSILANYNPKVLFEDMTKERILPKLDLYVCGFPCQPFSLAGNRKGSDDSRGNIFIHCINVIKQTSPSIFILENVKGILTVQKGEYIKEINRQLALLEEYNIKLMILNTKDYGIPQNRERLFIVGIMKSKIIKTLEVPKHITCGSIESFIDYSDTQIMNYPNYQLQKMPQFRNTVFCNINTLRPENVNNKVNPNYCNTITCRGVWCIKLQRIANIKEHLTLQGFPTDFKQVVSDCQMRKQIGNSMSVNVLVCLLSECFNCVSFL